MIRERLSMSYVSNITMSKNNPTKNGQKSKRYHIHQIYSLMRK